MSNIRIFFSCGPTHLRGENRKLKLTNQSLQKDLNLATKLAELRKVPYFESEFNFSLTAFKYGVYVARNKKSGLEAGY